MDKRKKNRLQIILSMLLVLLFYMAYIIREIPLHTSSDELGAIVSAAYLAKRNWSGVIDRSGYYGFGFFFQFFWVFKLTDNPIIIYRVILSFCALERVCTIPIIYYISKKYMGIKKHTLALIMSIAISLLHTQRVVTLANEYTLELLIWLNIWVLCKLNEYIEDVKKKNIYTIVLIAILTYSLTIHTRMLVLIIANIILILAYKILYKKKLVSWEMLIVGLCIGGIVKYGIKIYQNEIWNTGNGSLRNASASISKAFNIFDIETWKVWIHMILGMIDTMTLVFAGLFLLSIVVFIYYSVICIKRRDKENVNVNIIFMLTFLSMGATILAFLFSGWGEGMLLHWNERGQSDAYAYKGLTYIRYWEPYVVPFILAAMSVFINGDINRKKALNITMICYIVLQILFIILVLPLIQTNGDALAPLRGISMYDIEKTVEKSNYFTSILIATSVFVMVALLIQMDKIKLMFGIIILFIVFQYNYSFVYYDFKIQERMNDLVDASYEEVQNLISNGNYIENIYIFETNEKKDNNWKIYSIAQFYLNDFCLIQELPETLGKNDILITNGEIENFAILEEINSIVLDDNEIWYININNNWNISKEE